MKELETRYREVRALIRAHSLFRVAQATGNEGDDLTQSVFVGLLVRQRGRSAYDAKRSSLARYVWLVTGSVIANLLDSQRRRARYEVVGWWDARGAPCDAAQVAEQSGTEDWVAEGLIVAELLAKAGGDELDQLGVVLLLEGRPLAQVRRLVGATSAAAIEQVRERLRVAWTE